MHSHRPFIYEGNKVHEDSGGDFTAVLVVREFNQFEPDALENKNYASGIGLVLVEEDLDDEGDPDFVLELISIDIP